MSLSECILSVETAIFNGPTTKEKIMQIKNCGFDRIELCAVKHRFDYNDSEYVDDMVKFILDNGVDVVSMHLPFGNDLDLSSLDKSVRTEAVSAIKKCIKIATRLGCKILVLHPGVFMDALQDRRERLSTAIESIRELLLDISDNMLFAVENLPPDFLAHTADELCAIVEALNDKRVGYCIDTGHAHITGQIEKLIEGCSDKTYNIHIHDNHGKKDNHIMPFEGTIDWQNMLNLLNEVNFEGLLTYELTNEENALEKIASIKANFDCLCNMTEPIPA